MESLLQQAYKTAIFTRKITESILHRLIREYAPYTKKGFCLGEMGGASSCFYEGIKQQFNPSKYHVIDNNQLGLDKFRERVGNDDSVIMTSEDVRDLNRRPTLDMVFSVGLIEHFSIEDTNKAIATSIKGRSPLSPG